MKSVFINMLIIVVIAMLYFSGFFGWFTSKYVLWAAIGIIIMLFIVAFRVIGKPWAGKK